MSIPSISSVSICLRCQSRLLRRRPITSSRTIKRSYAALPSFQSTNVARPRKGILSRHPLRKNIDGYGGTRVRLDTARLENTSLGQPSEIIIIRQPEATSTEIDHVPQSIPSVKGELATPELLDSLDALKGLPNSEEVQKNIEDLRPANADRELPRQEYESLSQQMYDGFLVEQLAAYVEKHRIAPPTENLNAKRNTRGNSRKQNVSLHVSEWSPGVTAFLAPPSAKDGAPLRKDRWTGKGKHGLVDELLRRCWRLEVKEEVASIGELEITLAPRQLSLLLSERRQLLKGLAERRNAKIDVSRLRSVMRITADRETSRRVVRDTKSILANFQCAEVDLRPLRAVVQGRRDEAVTLDQSTFDSMAQITGTELESLEDGEKLAIYSMGPGSTDADDARRMLLSLCIPESNNRAIYVAEEYGSTGSLYVTRTGTELPWHQRQKAWCRLQHPVFKEGDTELELLARSNITRKAHAGYDVSQKVGKHLNGPANLEPMASPDLQPETSDGNSALASSLASQSAVWAPSRTSTHATVGLQLHQISNPSVLTKSTAQAMLDETHTPRTLSPSVPDLVQFVAQLPREDQPVKEQLCIYASPSPWRLSAEQRLATPPLEITMDVDPDNRGSHLSSVRAVAGEHIADVMLPSHAADVRFTRRELIELMDPSSSEGVMAFLDRSNLNVKGQGRLRTPPTLRIQVPQANSRLSASQRLALSTNNLFEAEYLFTSLCHRQTVALSYEGLQVQYTSVEAGRTGGRRCEVQLLMDAKDAQEQASDLVKFQAYYDSVIKFIVALRDRRDGVPTAMDTLS